MNPLIHNVKSESATIYQLNVLGTNNWSALVQPVAGSNINAAALASDLALAPKLLNEVLDELISHVHLGKSRDEAIKEIEDKFPDLLRLNYINKHTLKTE